MPESKVLKVYPGKESGIAWHDKGVGSLTVEHMLFLVGGFLLGMALVGLAGTQEPNVALYAGAAVVGLCTLIVGQQSAARNRESSSED